MSITELLARAEQCHREVALEYYNAYSGRQEQLGIAAILEKYPELSSRETLNQVKNLSADDVPDEREQRFLRLVFTANYFSGQLKSLTDRLANSEGAAVVECDGEQIPYRAAPVVLANEANYERRGRLGDAYLAKLTEMNPLRAETEQLSREITRDLGYRDVVDMVEQLALMRIYPLRDSMLAFLAETENVYEERLARYAAETPGLTRESLRHLDVGYMLRGGRFDELFPRQDLVPALARTLIGLGIDLEGQTNVTLDLEARPRKTPRAFCIGISNPQDVRLVLQPHGGQDDYSTLFHESGHLEFGAHMSADLPYVYRQYGDTSVHESYAFLLQHLLSDPVWWREIMGTSAAGEYIRFARFQRLYLLRRYGSKLDYEVEFHESDGGPQLGDVYAAKLSQGCRFAYPPERYLQDMDFGFYVAQYLQAWIWECQLRSLLKRDFGDAWFTQRQAGDFLRGLWSEGQKYDVWEIAEKLGFDGLEISLLQEELVA